ncbi:hypothetical protein SYNTR_0742 [Candidatus Syntrophocurvum alkaliphilum]|uniref:Uncharacterized protein n=1 Tax=Candidatus Syntrophocurvum alkaliphilum TaxID=2293317 RepID=A0A6I6D8Z1_9FIRM|nr:hypothetical protein SYNTR_0742 [Candidatus Syntrophocurvum alkaliphilum]
MPPIAECEKFFSEFSNAIILRVESPAHHRNFDFKVFEETDDKVLELEKDLFYAGYYKAMAFSATICYRCGDECAKNTECKNNYKSRPTPEALGVDIFATVKKIGYPIEVLSSYDQNMNRYYLIMIE